MNLETLDEWSADDIIAFLRRENDRLRAEVERLQNIQDKLDWAHAALEHKHQKLRETHEKAEGIIIGLENEVERLRKERDD